MDIFHARFRKRDQIDVCAGRGEGAVPSIVIDPVL